MATATTEAALERLLKRRRRAWEDLGKFHRSLKRLDAEERSKVDEASYIFHDADRKIVRALRAADGPLRVGAVVLHLTADGENFAVCDPETGLPVHGRASRNERIMQLYDYAAAARLAAVGRRNCPGVCP